MEREVRGEKKEKTLKARVAFGILSLLGDRRCCKARERENERERGEDMRELNGTGQEGSKGGKASWPTGCVARSDGAAEHSRHGMVHGATNATRLKQRCSVL